MFVLLVLAAAVMGSEAFLLDAMGNDPLHANPLLVLTCEPIESTPSTKVMCEYRVTDLVCTATCAPGYGFPTGSASMTRSCTSGGVWPQGRSFPDCVSTINPGVPTIRPGGSVVGCVSGLASCPSNGLYPACNTCEKFVFCADDGAFLMDCAKGSYFDSSTSRCEAQSSTCRSS